METDDALPPISPELVVLRVMTEAHLRSLKPLARLRFQKALAEVLADADVPVVRMQARESHAAAEKARREAYTWVRKVLMSAMARG